MEFDELQGPEQTAALANMAVFARVEPSHKQRLVELLKTQVPLRYMCYLVSSRLTLYASPPSARGRCAASVVLWRGAVAFSSNACLFLNGTSRELLHPLT